MNPNVMYELGIVQSLDKPVIILAQNLKEVPFDVRHMRIIEYDPSPEGLVKAQAVLSSSIQFTVGHAQLEEAKKLISDSHFRAAVASLGVVMEHALLQLALKRRVPKRRVDELAGTRLSSGRAIDVLAKAKALTAAEEHDLKQALRVRNRAVHELDPVSKTDAVRFLKVVENLVTKYSVLLDD